MKKVLSLILALLMTASSASAILADEAIVDEEIEEAAIIEEEAEEEESVAGPYDRAIEFLYNYGIYKGKSADDLASDDDIERYQMALFTARLATGWVDDDVWEDGPEDWSEFKDLDEEPASNYLGAISYANQMGIVEGYGNGKFGPTDAITYQNALTMIVRTLGYQGLEWPWGYIAQAVKLGLTDGIVDVAYTDDLTRGEVAQIIYNALFATTKDGTTLALKSFGIEFGWEKVIITASDLNTFVQDKTGATKAVRDNAYSRFTGSNKPSDTFVTFQILNDDGTLADDVYYAKAEAFGLSGVKYAHDDEDVVGDAYYVLFEKDADSDLVEIVTYESLYVDTLWNFGKTDDDGVAQDYPIETFKAEYALVEKYTDMSYINVTASRKPEILLYTANSFITETYVDGNMIAIDWSTGNILQPVADADEKDGYAKDDNGKILYEVAWYYNSILERYYDYQTTSDGAVIAINWMSDAEFEKFYEGLNIKKTRSIAGFENITTNIAKTAYASIELFDTNLDGVVDRGIYESYKFGKFSPSTVWCGSCGANKASYSISNLNSYAVAAAKADNDADISDTYAFNVIAEGVSCGHNAARSWFVEGYEPMTNDDGEYVACYVIYSYDIETGAIKVVKVIDDETDDDSFVATGVVRAYNASKETITIGDTQYTCNYDELAGTGFYIVNKNTRTKAAYTTFLRGLFNQYVEYVVVDGEVVFVQKLNAADKELIVVDSYAGISSDGYIVINGYSTSDLKLDRFRIGSYDGNIKGDPFYYMTDALAEAAFTKGAVYAISSYDKTEDIYYVQLAGEFSGNQGPSGYTYVVDTDYAILTPVSITENGNGYMGYTIDGKASDKKMKSDDKYIIITSNVGTFQNSSFAHYAPIIVYEGKLPTGWSVTGDELGATNDNTYVIVNATSIIGFKDTYKTGLVLLLNKDYTAMEYDGADTEGWYLLGSTEVEVEVFDLFTGEEDNVIRRGTNIDLTKGHVYVTNDGVIVEDLGTMMYASTFVNAAQFAYLDSDTYYAEFITGTAFTSDYYSSSDYKKNIETKLLAQSGIYSGVQVEGYEKYRGDKVDSVKYRVVEYNYDTNGNIESIKSIKNIDRSKIAAYMADENLTKLYSAFIYDVAGCDIVFYLFPTERGENETVETVNETGLSYEITLNEYYGEWVPPFTTDVPDVVAELKAKVYYTNTLENGNIVSQTIEGIELYYDVPEDTTHANIAKYGWHFGIVGSDTVENYTVNYTIGGFGGEVTDVLSSVVSAEYMNGKEDCDECALVQAIYFDIEDVKVDVTANKKVVSLVDDFTVTLSVRNDLTVLFGDDTLATLYNELVIREDYAGFDLNVTITNDIDKDGKIIFVVETRYPPTFPGNDMWRVQGLGPVDLELIEDVLDRLGLTNDQNRPGTGGGGFPGGWW